MKKMKRILALIGIILLVGLYVISFIASIFNTSFSHNLFTASLYCTFIVPIMIYGYTLVYKVLKGKKDQKQEEDRNDDQQ